MSPAPALIREVFLSPGELHFGDRTTRIRTMLGSCVALTVWHPQLLIGGMCHYLLPSRSSDAISELPGRYADEAIGRFLQEIRVARTRVEDYQMKIFGGGQMFHSTGGPITDIGQRNIEAALHLSRHHGFPVTARQLGGRGSMSLCFQIWSGDVWCKVQSPVKGAL